MSDVKASNLRALGRQAEEICETVMKKCYEVVGADHAAATPDQMLVVLHLGLLTTAYLEATLKAGMEPDEKIATRAFLDQFSSQIEHKILTPAIQHPSTPQKGPGTTG